MLEKITDLLKSKENFAFEKLIEFKIKMNSELVILKNGKIVRIKPVATTHNN